MDIWINSAALLKYALPEKMILCPANIFILISRAGTPYAIRLSLQPLHRKQLDE
jgi:hypothetical protein